MAEIPKYFYFRTKSDGITIQIEDASDADVVEVVRCKDCVRHTDEEPGMVYCPHIIGGWCDDDWFCKSGKEQEHDKR